MPAKIGRYEVKEKLGSGSTGAVYRATDPFIGRTLAIKVFRVDLPAGPMRDHFLQRFYHEARISGGLSHPNIVALFDVGEIEGVPYLVFEHVEGPTLDVALAKAGRLDSNETIRILEQAGAALDFAHSKGVVHRDIRPANIILADDRRVRIADFGIARIEGSQLTQHGEILGTPAYMSPEQIRGHDLSASSDLFSLAVCAYEMLTGQRPFVGKTQPEMLEALVYSPPAEPKELRQLGIPSRDFMFVFERALAKEPSHRFVDAAAFARALKSCLGFASPGDEPTPVARIAIPDPLPGLRRAILPPVAPPPPPPKVDIGTAATGEIEGGPGSDHADATMVSPLGFARDAEEKKGVSPSDATMVAAEEDATTLGFDQRLKARPEAEPEEDAVTLGFDQRLKAKPEAGPEEDAVTLGFDRGLKAKPEAADEDAVTLGFDKGLKAGSEEDAATLGFDQGLKAKPSAGDPRDQTGAGVKPAGPASKGAASADATMLTPDDDLELPTTQRLSRQAVESLLSRSSPAQSGSTAAPAAGPPLQKTLPGADKPTSATSSVNPLEGLVPPTREMPSQPGPPPQGSGAPPLTAETLHDRSRTGRPSTPPPTKSADKTLIMSEAEKATAARLRDRSAADLPPTRALPRPTPAPAPAPYQPGTRPPVARPPANYPPAMPQLAAPAPVLPKIIIGIMALLTLLALGLGIMFWGGAGRQVPQVTEKWNNLPVYPEAEVEKSPLLFSHEIPKPKLEPGRVVSVTVSWIVTPDGVVDDPRIVQSASQEIDAFVVEAVRKWRYEPGQKDGKTVPVRVLRKYTFGQRSPLEGS